MVKIVEKYFNQEDFSKREKEVLEKVVNQTGFIPHKLIYKGIIFDPDKVGSIIYKGIYKGKTAILKLQGLFPDTDESDIMQAFAKQNKSKIIRLPKLYAFKKWNKKDGFGYVVTEYIDAPKIYEIPFATGKQMQLFCDFYQEYKTKCLNKPFTYPDRKNENASEFVIRRVRMWKKISDHKKKLQEIISRDLIEKKVNAYIKFMAENLKGDLVFCHGHLSSKDIFYNGKDFILLSNLYWGWRPEYYDLIFGLHWCLEAITDEDFTFEEYLNYVNEWLSRLYEIPVVKKDKQAKKKINLMLLERTMGAVLIDTLEKKDDIDVVNNLINLQLKFFDYLINTYES